MLSSLAKLTNIVGTPKRINCSHLNKKLIKHFLPICIKQKHCQLILLVTQIFEIGLEHQL